MPIQKQRVKYDVLKGSKLHHDLRKDPAETGDREHNKDQTGTTESPRESNDS